jgi:NADH:ubiquinone oxidoreductase subunit K
VEEKRDNASEGDRDMINPTASTGRSNIIGLLDDFIYQILSIRKMLFALFVFSVIFAPISIGLSVYIFTHPSFDNILDAEDNFGEVLEVLLVAIFAASSVWLALGIKQYKSIGSWNKRFKEYQREQSEIDKKIKFKYGLSNGAE